MSNSLRISSVFIGLALAACGGGLDVASNTTSQALEDCGDRIGDTRVCQRHVDVERADVCARLVDAAQSDASLRDRASDCLAERDYCVTTERTRDGETVRDERCARPDSDRPLDACRRALNSDNPEIVRQAHARCGIDIASGDHCEVVVTRNRDGETVREEVCDRPSRPDLDACDRLAASDRMTDATRCYDDIDRPDCDIVRVESRDGEVTREEICIRPAPEGELNCAIVVDRLRDGSLIRDEVCRDRPSDEATDERPADEATDERPADEATDERPDDEPRD